MSQPAHRAALTAIKRALAQTLYATGVLGLLKRRTLRGRAVVLTYHRVLADADCEATWSHPAIVVRTATFERQIALLRREFTVLTLKQFQAGLSGREPFPPGACLITFDDGWRDTATQAWPVLRRHGVSAVVFVSTGYLGTTAVLWQEHLRALLHHARRQSRREPEIERRVRPVLAAHGYQHVLDAEDAESRRVIIDAVLARKYDGPAQATATIAALEQLLPDYRESASRADGFMDWSMAATMAKEGAVFGSHGVTHRLLATLAESDVIEELTESRDQVERHTGQRPGAMAYPDGNRDAAVAAALPRTGYQLAFSTDGGHVSPGDDPWSIKRLNIHEAGTADPALFMARLVGLF